MGEYFGIQSLVTNRVGALASHKAVHNLLLLVLFLYLSSSLLFEPQHDTTDDGSYSKDTDHYTNRDADFTWTSTGVRTAGR